MKTFNIIGWIITIGLFLAAPLVDALIMYSMALVCIMVMTVVSLATVYDDIDDEIIKELKLK